MRTTTSRALAALAATGLLVAGCGDTDDPGPTTGPAVTGDTTTTTDDEVETTTAPTTTGATTTTGPTTTTGTASPTTATSTTAATTTTGTSTGTAAPIETDEPDSLAAQGFVPADTVVEVTTTEEPGHFLDGIRFGVHEGYDRVVLDLTGGGVSYRVRFVEQALADGSGLPIALPGDGALAVTLIGMAYDEEGHYDREERVAVDGQVVLETYEDGTFEGQLTVFVATDAEHPFRVLKLTDPDRVVVDVAVADRLDR